MLDENQNPTVPKSPLRLIPDTPDTCKELLSASKIKVCYDIGISCIFRKKSNNPCGFGETVCMIIPEHGELGCPCLSDRFVKQWENKGFVLEKVIEE